VLFVYLLLLSFSYLHDHLAFCFFNSKINHSVMQVNAIGAEVLEYIADFGKATAPLPAAILACVPKKVHVDGIGETEFKISPTEITDAIKAGLEEPIEAEPEVSFIINLASFSI
jgi:hypothetical protein